MSAHEHRSPAVAGLIEWYRSMDLADLDDVIAELLIGQASLQLARAVREERRFDELLVAIVGEAVPEVDPRNFVQAIHEIQRRRRQQNLDPDDPLAVLDAAAEVSWVTTNEERTP